MPDPRLAILEVSGMTCDDCASHVTSALEQAGALDVSVTWQDGQALFTWPEEIAEIDLRAAVSGAGYRPGDLKLSEVSEKLPLQVDRDKDYDLIVIGAGSAAFAAAIKATEAGYRVALVEEGTLGGTCVNVGCVPSKALLKAGELAWAAENHPFIGVNASLESVDLAQIVLQKDQLVSTLRQVKYADLVEDYGFTVLSGHARFSSSNVVEVDGKPVTASKILVATGASPSIPPIPGLNESEFLTSTTALELKDVPRSIAVIGANAIGLELGQFLLHLGSKVTFIDVANRIAPFEEPEISGALSEFLTAQGALIYTSANIAGVSTKDGRRVIHLNIGIEPHDVEVDQILVATGRRPNTEGLGLEQAGIETDARGAVVVDDHLRTSNPSVYAAGDVTGAPQFVYVSAYEGALAVDNALLGFGRVIDFRGLPRVTFTSPQIASAGLTEAQARESGYEVVTSILPVDAIPRALVNRETKGLFKLVAEVGTGKLLGASIMAEGAGEVIQSAVLAIKYGISVDDLASTFHPYLTMVEGLKLAAQTFTRDVHKLSCCAA